MDLASCEVKIHCHPIHFTGLIIGIYMSTQEFIEKLNQLNLSLAVYQERLTLKGHSHKLSPKEIKSILGRNNEVSQYIQENRGQLLKHLTQESRAKAVLKEKRSDNISAVYPLSPLQQGMLFHSIYNGNGSAAAYLNQFSCDFNDLNVAAFQKSWDYLLSGHSILRTAFFYEEFDLPLQAVFKRVQLPFEVHDLSRLSEQAQKHRLEAFLLHDRAKGFNFKEPPLMRISLFKLGAQKYRLVWTHHHILTDGWSTPIMMSKLIDCYKAILENRPIPALVEDRYEDYIRYIESKDAKEQEAFWQNYLGKINGPSLLPFTKENVDRNKGGASIKKQELSFDQTFSECIETYAQQNHLTINSIVQGVWSYLLSRYTAQSDVVFGVTVSGRPPDLANSSERVGLYINTIPFCTQIDLQQPISDWLNDLQQAHTRAREFQYTALSTIQKWKNMQGDLFDSIIVFENYPVGDDLVNDQTLDGGEVEVDERTNYLLEITVAYGRTLNIQFLYNDELLDEQFARLIAGHFEFVLRQIIQSPAEHLTDLELLTPAELQQLKFDFNDSAVPYLKTKTIIDLFAEQVQTRPDAIAVVGEHDTWTFRELDQRSNRLAHFLRDKGIGVECPVPLCMDRSPHLLLAIWSVFKAGGAYLPIDPSYPLDRINHMLRDSGSPIMIGMLPQKRHLESIENTELVFLDQDWHRIQEYQCTPVDSTVNLANLAYLIYTSGSTGRPKGVMIEHEGMLNHLFAMIDELQVDDTSRVLQNASQSFDISVWQLLTTQITGGTTYIYPQTTVMEPGLFMANWQRDQLTHVQLVPSYLKVLFDQPEFLQLDLSATAYVLVTGEALPVELAHRWFEHFSDIPLVNAYGPAEAADDVTLHIMRQPPRDDRMPIGQAVQNMRLYVFDEDYRLCPIGVPGEIGVAGVGVGRGYLNLSERTARSFVANPYEEKGTLYKTGDLGYWSPAGELVFMGRLDDQVKINGHRIELGEIKELLLQHKLVKDAVVIVRTDDLEHKRLVGYVVVEAGFQKNEIETYLSSSLPRYMVPSIWVELPELPLNANGKVDKKALPAPTQQTQLQENFQAPISETETILANVWQELLGANRIGLHDNFFELGGDSIISIQVVSRARQKGLFLKPKDLFEFQTIAELALNVQHKAIEIKTEQGPLSGPVPLLPIQQRFFDLAYAKADHYNQALIWGVDKSLSTQDLEKVITALMKHHDALRLQYHKTEGQWRQEYGAFMGQLSVEDLSKVTADELPKYVPEICYRYQEGLVLEKGEISRFVLIRTPEEEPLDRLFVGIHHLAVDGVSWRILVEDIERALQQLSEDKPIDLGPKTSSFRQWTQALSAYAQQHKVEAQLDYWLAANQAYKPLPVDKSKCPVKADYTAFFEDLSPAYTTMLLKGANKAFQTEVNDFLLAALAKTFCDWTQEEAVVIGLEGHGREAIDDAIDTSRTVGWFTNLYPVLLSSENFASSPDTIKSVKEQLRRLPDRGIGYGALRYLHPEAAIRQRFEGTQCWDIEFNYLGQIDNAVQSGKWLHQAGESAGKASSVDNNRDAKLMVDCFVVDGELRVSWNYSKYQYKAGTIRRLAGNFIQNLEELLTHASSMEVTQPTPADFGLSQHLSYQELDAFLVRMEGARIAALYPLSPLQEGILFHSLYNANSGAYIDQFVCEFVNLDQTAFKASWNQLLRSHSIMRTAFFAKDFSLPLQAVFEKVDIPFEEIDCSSLSPDKQDVAISLFLEEDRRRGFDLTQPPLTRVTIFKLDEQRHRLVWSCHHILTDGWSTPVIMEELLVNYERFQQGQAAIVRKEDRFEDYIRYIEEQDTQLLKAFWQEYLSGIDGPSLLPFTNSSLERNRGGIHIEKVNLHFEAAFTQELLQFAAKHRITVNTIMQGVWAYLLSTYTAKKDVVYGVTVSGRPPVLKDAEDRVGPYINTIPLSAALDAEAKIGPWLVNLQKGHTQAREYQYASLNAIQNWKGISGDFFDSILVFENYPVGEELMGEQALEGSNVEMDERTNYLLTVVIAQARTLDIHFDFNSDLLDKQQVECISGHFQQVLTQMIKGEELSLSEIQILTTIEREQLLHKFNDTQKVYAPATILDLFAQQVLKSPDSIAVQFEEEILSYADLDAKSNQLGHYLLQLGVKKGELIGLCLERSLDMMVGILGIMKAGGAYVPIDPAYPKERIEFILSDINAKLVLTQAEVSAKLIESSYSNEIKLLDLQNSQLYQGLLSPSAVGLSPNDPAYVIYTSGSTGRPKGVLNEHRGVVNRLLWGIDYFNFTPEDVFLQKTTFCFDVSVWELFSPLLVGAKLVFAAPNGHKDPAYLRQLVEKQSITTIHFVSSMLEAFLLELPKGACPSIQRVISSGEAVLPSHVRMLKAAFSNAGFYNLYGPTEAAIEVSFWEAPTHYYEEDFVPIGRPSWNTQLHILDEHGKLVPIGVPGELHIGGTQVARGYLNHPLLSAEKFIPDPFETGARLYKTGDLAAWLPNGQIKYLGRKDDQVKVRGYRIELGEINEILSQCSQVKNSVVVANKDKHGQVRLIAYVVPVKALDKKEVESFLKAKLPEYMIPSVWMEMEALPLNSNGKIDRKHLPTPDATALSRNTFVAPETENQARIISIWKELLLLERISVLDDFFELGGHSLLALRLLSALRRAFDVDLSVRDLFEYSTVVDLAKLVENRHPAATIPSLTVVNRPAKLPLSFAQERLFFIDQLQGSVQYHIPMVMSFDGELDTQLVEKTFQEIVNRHEVLRTVFREEEGTAYQYILPDHQWRLEKAVMTENRRGISVRKMIMEFVDRPFDLSQDHMLRAKLIEVEPHQYQLALVIHHIAADGWSMNILTKEFADIFNALQEGNAIDLPDLPIQYADYAVWQRQFLGEDVLAQELAYWTEQLADTPSLDLPTDFVRPNMQSTRGAAIDVTLNKDVYDQLQQLTQKYQTTLYTTLLAAFKVLLYRYSRQRDICVGTPIAGRQQPDTQPLIGFFVNMLAIRSQLAEHSTFVDILKQVKQTTLDAYAHQQVPFEQIVDTVTKVRDLSRSPIFQVTFTLNNASTNKEEQINDSEALQTESIEEQYATFDLNFDLEADDHGLKLNVQYCTDLFERQTVERMIRHFQTLLYEIALNPQQTIDTLNLLDEEERAILLGTTPTETGIRFNEGPVELHNDQPINLCFERVVAKNGQLTAVVHGEVCWSFDELNAYANQVRYSLEGMGVKPGDFVGIYLERSPVLVGALMGILKAGAVYVPLDTDNPAERIQKMLGDSRTKFLISSSDLLSPFEDLHLEALLCVDQLMPELAEVLERKTQLVMDAQAIDTYPMVNGANVNELSSWAYMLYTSGSTGTPKGAITRHDGAMNHILAEYQALELPDGFRFLQSAGIGSDISVWQILGPLLKSGTTVIIDKVDLLDYELLLHCLNKEQVHIVEFVPSYLWGLVEYMQQNATVLPLPTLQWIMMVGEQVPVKLVNAWRSIYPEVRILNGYGPCEAADDVAQYEITTNLAANSSRVPIGRPLANMNIAVLDQNQNLCPIGVPGEICVSGIGVGAGYWGLPEKTAQQFINNPFPELLGDTLYKTGDLGRWLSSGKLEFLGRLGRQVKIRGQRVELEEIESFLREEIWVKEAHLLIHQPSENIDKLLCFLSLQETQESRTRIIGKSFLNRIEQRLEDYLIDHQALKDKVMSVKGGLKVLQQNRCETLFLYDEIFKDQCYLQHGIELAEDAVVFDVGANIGVFSMYVSMLCPKSQVFAFEPLPPTFELLQANSVIYGEEQRIKAFQVGLSNEAQVVTFTHYPENTMLSGCYGDLKADKCYVRSVLEQQLAGSKETKEVDVDQLVERSMKQEHYQCQLLSLSDVIAAEGVDRIDLLKIDVERSEWDVLQGIKESDWPKIQQMVIEVHDEGDNLERITDLLRVQGFQFHLEQEKLLEHTDLYNIYALRKNKKQKASPQLITIEEVTERLQSKCQRGLPQHMQPSEFVVLESIPHNLSDKVDENQLIASYQSMQLDKPNLSADFTEAKTETQKTLIRIWQELLQRERIGIDEDFFKLGGHSLLAMRVIAAIKKQLQVVVRVISIFEYSTVASLAAHIDSLEEGLDLPPIEARPRPDFIPLSFAQERLWFIDQLEGSVHYHLPMLLQLEGPLDRLAFEFAFNEIINRHEVLRTVYQQENGVARQEVLPKNSWQLAFLQTDSFGTAESLEAWTRKEMDRPFDLSKDHMLRVYLIEQSIDQHLLMIVMHHIASDGWSMSILVDELFELYYSQLEARPADLTALPVQYADYAIWQREHLTDEIMLKKLDWWEQKLIGSQPLELVTDYPRPAVQSTNGAELKVMLDKDVSQALLRLSLDQGATLFMTLLAAFQVLLYRFSGQKDISVGTAIGNRELQEIEPLIGFFINSVVLRTQLDPAWSFEAFLQRLRKDTLDAFAHQEVPFEQVVERLDPKRDLSRSPLFQAMFVLQNTPGTSSSAEGAEEGLRCYPVAEAPVSAKFDLTLRATQKEQGIHLEFEYCTDLFKPETISRFMDAYQEILQTLVLDPKTIISQFNLLKPREEKEILALAKVEPAPYELNQTLIDLFREQVVIHQQAICLSQGDRGISYQEVEDRSNQMAQLLIARGVKPRTLVAICLDRSIDLMIAILGVLKSGAAYLPIDPDYPRERVNYLLHDSKADYLISTSNIDLKEVEWSQLEIILIDQEKAVLDTFSTAAPSVTLAADQLAYILYTSGSTGRPKAVAIEHDNLSNYLQWCRAVYPIDLKVSMGLHTSIGFDLTVTSIFLPIITGGQVVIAERQEEGQLDLIPLLHDERIDTLKLTPSHLRLLEGKDLSESTIRTLIVGGERLTTNLAQRVTEAFDGKVKIYNEYGPTEVTVGCICHLFQPDQETTDSVPIGKPIFNTDVYVMDEAQNLVGRGVMGELYIGGDGLARGYLNKAELSLDRFIAHPFQADKKLYRTGDRVRWLPEGKLLYLGRTDEQVKIRGHRIEPSEIEAVLQINEEIKSCVIIARPDHNGYNRLIAYVVPVTTFDAKTLEGYLRERLPTYMVPSVWLELEEIPLTVNGKVNKKALPRPTFTSSNEQEYISARTIEEEVLVAAWQNLLGLERIGVFDNFFSLGGDSIVSIQVVSQLAQAGYSLRPRDLFMYQTIAELAPHLKEGVEEIEAEQGTLRGALDLTPIQSWFFDRAFHVANHYNQAVLLQLDKKFGEEQLAEVVQHLIAQHDVLRLKYTNADGEWLQYFGDQQPQLHIEDLSAVALATFPAEIELLCNKYQETLDIEAGNLCHFIQIQTPAGISHNRLLVVIHHLAIDGVSWRILLEDLTLLLNAIERGVNLKLRPKTSSYRQWQETLAELAMQDKLEGQLSYWEQAVEAYRPLPRDISNSKLPLIKEETHHAARLDQALTTDLLQHIHHAYNTQINDILLSALSRCLCSWTGFGKVVVGFEGHGRVDISNKIDVSRTLGWFTNMYPVWLKAPGQQKEADLIKSVKEQLRQLPDQGIGFGVLKYLHPDPSIRSRLSREPAWDIVFNYLGQFDNALEEDGVILGAAESTGYASSPRNQLDAPLTITCSVVAGQLTVIWSYSNLQFETATIDFLANSFLQELQLLIQHCKNKKETEHTPSDFGFDSSVSYQDLEAFLNEEDEEEDFLSV